MIKTNKCELPRCREPVHLLYYGHGVCRKHWFSHCNNKIDLKVLFKIKGEKNETLPIS